MEKKIHELFNFLEFNFENTIDVIIEFLISFNGLNSIFQTPVEEKIEGLEKKIFKIDQLINVYSAEEFKENISYIAYYSLKKANFYAFIRNNRALAEKSISSLFQFLFLSKNKFETALYYYVAGLISNLLLAKRHYFSSLEIAEEINAKYLVVQTCDNLGVAFVESGEIDLAIEYAKKCITVNKDVGTINFAFITLGRCYYRRGDFKNSVKYLLIGLSEYKAKKSYIHELSALTLLAEVNFHKGNEIEAEKLLNECEVIVEQKDEEILNQKFVIDVYFLSFKIAIKNNNDSLIEKYYDKISLIHEKFELDKAIYIKKLAEAMKLKNSKRIKNKVRAMDLFNELLLEKTVDYNLTTMIYSYLCELLIEEYQHYGGEDVLSEIQDNLNQLTVIGKNHVDYYLVLVSMRLKSKVEVVKANLDSSMEILQDALRFIKENDLLGLQTMIEDDISELHDNWLKFENIVNSNPITHDKLKNRQIEKYWTDVKNILDLQ